MQAPVQFSKWPTGVAPDTPLGVAASRTIQQRLEVLRRWLPKAARRGLEDPERVHQLRVWSRRSAAALQLYWDILPKKRRRRLNRWLRQTRAAAGQARDLDVFLERVAADEGKVARRLRATLSKKRIRAQRPIAQVFRRLRNGRKLRTQSCKMGSRLENNAGKDRALSQPFAPWAKERLWKTYESFLAAEPPRGPNIETLHRFRIEGKRLRYAMEATAPALNASFLNEAYPLVEALQDKLGVINDHRVAREDLSRMMRGAKRKKRETLEQWIATEEQALVDAVQDFRLWWGPDLQQRLHCLFESALKETPERDDLETGRSPPSALPADPAVHRSPFPNQ